MNDVSMKLTVYFDTPFWVGVLECKEDEKLSVVKITFGQEPKDYEVYHFLLRNYSYLQFSPAVETVVKKVKMNPKRMQRVVRKQLLKHGVSTKSQQAIKLQQEQIKQKNHVRSKRQKELKKNRLFEMKQQKRKEKHKGH